MHRVQKMHRSCSAASEEGPWDGGEEWWKDYHVSDATCLSSSLPIEEGAEVRGACRLPRVVAIGSPSLPSPSIRRQITPWSHTLPPSLPANASTHSLPPSLSLESCNHSHVGGRCLIIHSAQMVQLPPPFPAFSLASARETVHNIEQSADSSWSNLVFPASSCLSFSHRNPYTTAHGSILSHLFKSTLLLWLMSPETSDGLILQPAENPV